VENSAAGVNRDADKSPDQIEREMEHTRESITEKVSLLENQVMGNVHAVADAVGTVKEAVGSVKDAVTGTVEAMKETLTSAPAAMSDTVKQTVAAMKDSVKDTVNSIDVSGCVRDNPWAALGTSVAGGFLLGFLMPSGNRGGGLFGRPLMARGHDTPVSGGRVGTAHTAYAGDREVFHPAAQHAAATGFFGSIFGQVGNELRQLAEQAISTGLASLKESLHTQVPQMVDAAVHKVTDRVTGSDGSGPTTRVGGPNYTANAPAAGL